MRKILLLYPVIMLFSFSSIVSCSKKDSSVENPKEDSITSSSKNEKGFGFIHASDTELSNASEASHLLLGSLPTSFFLPMPPIGDQGNQGSCVSWAVGYAVQSYYVNKTNGTNYESFSYLCSPKYLYNQAKYNPFNCSSGSTFPANFEVLKTKGICTLADMPYNDTECFLLPNSYQNNSALANRILKWERVDKTDISNIKALVYSGTPVLIGITVDEGLNNLGYPFIWTSKSGNPLGGHAVAVVGYDDSKKAFKVQNSWGTSWGDAGFFWITYSFFPSAVFECYVTFPLITKSTDDLRSGLMLDIPVNANANDVSGNNNNGIVENARLVQDRRGNENSAYEFGGFYNPSYIKIPSSESLNFSSAVSISFWLRINSTGGTGIPGNSYANGVTANSLQTVLFKGLNNKSITIDLIHQKGDSYYEVRNSTGGFSTPLLYNQIGRWTHFVYVYSKNRFKLYKDGSIFIDINTDFDFTEGNNQPLFIGKSNISSVNSNGYPLNAVIDDFRIYNRALEESEVQKIYNL